jgi:hypothetical protein
VAGWFVLFMCFVGTLAFTDWAFPANVRLSAIGQFKSDPEDIERFYANYGRGRRVRLALAVILSLVASVIVKTSDNTKICTLAMVGAVFIYISILLLAMWRADRT